MAKKAKKLKPGINPNKIDIHIDAFGSIEHNFDIDKINEFLNENLDDWRLNEEQKSEQMMFEKSEEE